MAFNIAGLVALVLFYLLILVVGIWAGRKTDTPARTTGGVTIGEKSRVMLAGRNIGLLVGVFTMTATWVGGGYVNGTAEVVYTKGLTWCQAPFGFAFSLLIGGYLFAMKMRKAGYTTMLDPFQQHFGARMGGLLFIPALCGEVFWTAAILAALGASVEVIMDFERKESVIASACIAVFYTFTGGLYSVAYTDVVQLGAIFFGLWLTVPFAMFHEAVGPVSYPRNDYVGSVDWKDFGVYWDSMLLLMWGGVPWQVYFQRVLSSRTAEAAELMSYIASLGCLFMALPSVIIGAVAKASNLTMAGYTGSLPLTGGAASLTLPLVLQYLTPKSVSFVGLGAVSAAVMSSSDSCILSAASMFAWNIYRLGIRQTASEQEVIGVMRLSVVMVGALATVLALTAESVYGLWYLSSDLVYVILFPQLVCVVYLKEHVNTYGSLAAYVVGSFFRAGGGEAILYIPAFIKYPFYDYEEEKQLFPFRTFAMAVSFLTLLFVSKATAWLFDSGRAPLHWDIFKCFQREPDRPPSVLVSRPRLLGPRVVSRAPSKAESMAPESDAPPPEEASRPPVEDLAAAVSVESALPAQTVEEVPAENLSTEGTPLHNKRGSSKKRGRSVADLANTKAEWSPDGGSSPSKHKRKRPKSPKSSDRGAELPGPESPGTLETSEAGTADK